MEKRESDVVVLNKKSRATNIVAVVLLILGIGMLIAAVLIPQNAAPATLEEDQPASGASSLEKTRTFISVIANLSTDSFLDGPDSVEIQDENGGTYCKVCYSQATKYDDSRVVCEAWEADSPTEVYELESYVYKDGEEEWCSIPYRITQKNTGLVIYDMAYDAARTVEMLEGDANVKIEDILKSQGLDSECVIDGDLVTFDGSIYDIPIEEYSFAYEKDGDSYVTKEIYSKTLGRSILQDEKEGRTYIY